MSAARVQGSSYYWCNWVFQFSVLSANAKQPTEFTVRMGARAAAIAFADIMVANTAATFILDVQSPAHHDPLAKGRCTVCMSRFRDPLLSRVLLGALTLLERTALREGQLNARLILHKYGSREGKFCGRIGST
jgi:hypothetical protein